MVSRDLSKSWIEDEDCFRSQYEVGKRWERFVAGKLRAGGVQNVRHEDASFRSKVEEIAQYTRTSGDLHVGTRSLEVKSRTEFFNGPDDWRFWPMFVDTVSSLDQKEHPPHGYIIVSQITGRLMGVGCQAKDRWTKLRRFDRFRQIEDEFYCVPRNLVLGEEELIRRLREYGNE